MVRVPLTKMGLREIGLATVILGGPAAAAWAGVASAHAWCWLPAVALTLLWGFVLAFFRDPNRTLPADTTALVAPADGRITEITRLDQDPFVEGAATRFGIFLSVFDVHINRSPCSGVVRSVQYHPGIFLDARHPESGTRNEANTLVIDTGDPVMPTVVVRQIAGRIARRIICNVAPGDRVERGQRIGMIKFGSRTELIVPGHQTVQPMVLLGDRVRGAATAMGRPCKTAPSPAAGRGSKPETVEQPL